MDGWMCTGGETGPALSTARKHRKIDFFLNQNKKKNFLIKRFPRS